MVNLLDYPILIFVLSFIVLWLSAVIGTFLFRKHEHLEETVRENYAVILAATLTLLGLIIGFSFSMATSRYDMRKNYEEAEANAIGTEYVRADFLIAADADKVRRLLRQYTEQRVQFYETRNPKQLAQINADTAKLQTYLWEAVRNSAELRPNCVVALAVSGMNDVLNSQGYTQAAWWNRIPTAAWLLMATIAIFCNMLVGFGVKNMKAERILLPVLPLFVSVSFFLIADIDSPRGGFIHVHPDNLISLAESLKD